MRQVIRKTYISMSLRLSLRLSLGITPHSVSERVVIRSGSPKPPSRFRLQESHATTRENLC